MGEIEPQKNGPLPALPSLTGSRSEIMLRRRSSEQLNIFKNKELETRFKAASGIDYMIIWSGVIVAVISAVILSIVWMSQAFDAAGFSIVSGFLILSAVGMVTAGLVMRKNRQELYLRASELVLRYEPCNRQVLLTLGPKGAPFLSVSHADKAVADRKWRLANSKLSHDYPKVWKGIEAEVYLDPTSGQPLGMFDGEKVYWFI